MLRMIAVLIFYASGTVLGLMLPAMACCFYIVNDIFRPLDFARRVLDFPSVHLVTVVLVFSVFLRRTPKRWNTISTALLVITLWIFVCGMFSPLREFAMDEAWKYAKILLPLLLIGCVLTTRWSQDVFVAALAYSVGLWSAQAGLHGLLSGEPQTGMSIPRGQMTERNDFMVGCVTAIPLMLYVATHYMGLLRLPVRLGTKLLAGLSVVAIVFSGSRGAVVGFGVMTLYYVFRTGRASRRLVGVSALLLLVTFLLPEFLIERMETIDANVAEQSEASAQLRLEAMAAGVRMAVDNPVLGVGSSCFVFVVPRYGIEAQREPHSIWIKAAAEYGFPMLLFFLLVLGYLLRRLGHRRIMAKEAGDRATENLAIALACSMVGFAASASFTNTFLSEYFWAIAAVAGAFLADPESMGSGWARSWSAGAGAGAARGVVPAAPPVAVTTTGLGERHPG